MAQISGRTYCNLALLTHPRLHAKLLNGTR